MSSKQVSEGGDLTIENIGGIDSTSATITHGVTVLKGRNATNRTSFLQGIMAVLGSDNVSIKGDADEAHVELTIDGETYSRTLTRNGAAITATGEPYLEDSTVADLFAFLLESNDARQAVTQNADLREFIMRPVDTDEIQAEINRLIGERETVEHEIETIESQKGEIPGLEEERARLQEEIAEKREELAATETELESADTDVEQSREEKRELEEALGQLRERRSRLEDVRYDIETERETLEELTSEKSELTEKQSELPDAPAGEIEELDNRIQRLRRRKQAIEPQVNELQSIIRFNEDMLTDDSDLLTALDTDENEGDLTDQLVADQEVSCWTCGTTVETNRIESTIERLQEYSQQKLEKATDIDGQLRDLTDRRQTLEEHVRERDRIERRLSGIDDEIEESREAIDRLGTQREDLTDEIEQIEANVEEIEDEAYTEILDLHKEANQIEYDIGKLEGELEGVEATITDIETQLEELDGLKEERNHLQEELMERRTRIEGIEQEAVEAFNEHMDTVLDILDYENLERIWLERVEKEVKEGRRKVTKNAFHLHVVRSTPSGTTYEDSIDHLSESEREVTGLVFALAGYLAHDVAETVPFMLLDSLEAIDSNRIATLIDYLSEHTEYLVVTLLQEDAAALDIPHNQITSV